MSGIVTLEIPRLSSFDGGRGLRTKYALNAQDHDDPNLCTEAALLDHRSRLEAGEFPLFILESKLAGLLMDISIDKVLDGMRGFYVFESDVQEEPETDLNKRLARVCFDAVNQLIGEVPEGRCLQHFNNQKHKEEGNGDGQPHTDAFTGVTMHVQRKIEGRGVRNVRASFEYDADGPRRTAYPNAKVDNDDPRLWQGQIVEGDITFINSGLTLPDGSFLASVHQFKTVTDRREEGMPLSSFSQFIDYGPRRTA